MSKHEGLDLPQLLGLMQDLVVPEPVALWPQTPGWWIVLGWLLAVLVLIAWRYAGRRRQNRYRREALAELTAIAAQPGLGPAQTAQQIAALLKRTALAAYPRADVAALYGADWARFLKDSTGNDRQIAEAADLLAAAAYRPGVDGSLLVGPAQRWIRRHRA